MGLAFSAAAFEICQAHSAMAHLQDGPSNSADGLVEYDLGHLVVDIVATQYVGESNVGASEWFHHGRVVVDGAIGTALDATSQQFAESTGGCTSIMGQIGVAFADLVGTVAGVYTAERPPNDHGSRTTHGVAGVECQGLCAGRVYRF